jgi:hypothetical protein
MVRVASSGRVRLLPVTLALWFFLPNQRRKERAYRGDWQRIDVAIGSRRTRSWSETELEGVRASRRAIVGSKSKVEGIVTVGF